jgi:Glycosyltransferase family 87
MSVEVPGRRGSRSPLTPLKNVFDQTGPANRQLTFGLAALFVILMLSVLPGFLTWYFGVDLEIPLRAAGRFAGGGQPYLASSFSETTGPGLPFLYPPWLLPILVPIASLPRTAVLAVWLAFGLATAVWTCRRLSMPWIAIPFVLMWPPFTEGLVTGNVQLWQFAAFAALFYLPGQSWSPRPRDVGHERVSSGSGAGEAADRRAALRADLTDGLLAAGVGAMKYTQLLPLAWLLRPRWRAAVIGGVALAVVIVAMLPFTGIGIYRDWLDQLGRAADPSWQAVGAPLAFLVGQKLAYVATAAAVLACFFIRGRDAGAWVGIALIVAAPSIHGYGFLFLVPALLTIRRDLAISLAVIISRYNPYGCWAAVLVAAVTLLASNRFPALRVPTEGARTDA